MTDQLHVNIEKIFDGLLEREGGFVDDPSDSGGATNFGITEEVARDWGYGGPMVDLPESLARDIYVKKYWQDPGFDRVGTVSWEIAAEMLDTGVNMGTFWPGYWLQRWLNAYNNRYPDIAADGIVGPITVRTLEAFLGRRGAEGEGVMVESLNSMQGGRYLDIAERREKDKKFIYGQMLNRVVARS